MSEAYELHGSANSPLPSLTPHQHLKTVASHPVTLPSPARSQGFMHVRMNATINK